MRRFTLLLSAVFLVLIAASLADSLFVNQHPCETCGAEMQSFENGSTIYKCHKCGFMVDAAFQR